MPESCLSYIARDEKCSKRCDPKFFPKKYTSEKYGYIGGYYGALTEELMMKEIRARGPIPGQILFPQSLFYYKQGIYSNFHKLKHKSSITNKPMISRDIDWEKVEHSILIIGWGVEDGVKYWICMNSWGSHFGEKGFFKVLRGVNEINIETMGDVFRIKVEDRRSFE
jgi:cathepsin C